MRTAGRATLLSIALLLLAAPVRGDEKILRKARWFDVSAEEDLGIGSKTARQVEQEVEKALESAFELLGVGPKQVFYSGHPTPSWMGKAGKLQVVLMRAVPKRHRGVDYWVKQLFAGGFRLELPPPGETLTPQYRAVLWREVGVAVLGNTLFKTKVPWWTEGVLSLLQARGSGDPEATAKFRKEVADIPRGELVRRIDAALSAETAQALSKGSGKAVSFVVLDLLSQALPELVHHLQRQLQTMAYHLHWYPSDGALQRDSVRVARGELTQMFVSLDVLAAGLGGWADEGFPSGGDLRRSKFARRLRRVKLSPPFRVSMSGGWGGSRLDEYDRVYRYFEKGSISWRLPDLRSDYRLWTGVHYKLPRGQSFKPQNLSDGLVVELGRWHARPVGNRRFSKVPVLAPEKSWKYEFMLLDVTSSNRVIYRFYRYWKKK